MKLPGRGRRRAQQRHDKLAAGEAVEVPCHIRRTSSRGWGPWVAGELTLPASDPPSFVPADPLKRSLVSGRAGGSGPVPVEGPGSLSMRPVRFRGEAFYGIDGEVIVLTTERHVSEVATEPTDTALIADRLRSLGFGDRGKIPVVRVTELWRFPVKSMQGERLTAVDVTERGLRGDRACAVRDERSGLILTARREPKLLFASARFVDGAALVTLPDGSTADDDVALSAWLGYPVRLVAAAPDVHGTFEIALSIDDEEHAEWISWDGPTGRFHDSTRASVSLVTEASLRDWDVRRFRMNVIVDGEGEAALVGARLRLGSAEVDVQKRIDRCVMTTRPQPGGIERDLTVLKTINAELGGDLGIGGLVAAPGRVAIGDEIVRLA